MLAITKSKLIKKVKEIKNGRGAWSKAVKKDALELLKNCENLDKYSFNRWLELEKALLNGACDWKQYSYGGCALCSDYQIAKHYCNATELKLTDNGNKEPNKKESWLDVQARALYQASELIKQAFYELQGEIR